MVEKQFKKAVIVITILLVGIFFGLVNKAGANEQSNQVIPEKKPVSIQLQTTLNSIGNDVQGLIKWIGERPDAINNGLANEWQDIKEYQAQAWKDGKEQNTKNFNKIKSFLGFN